MNLFIDTNIYLTFYHFSNDDLEELRKLLTAIEGRRLKVFLPDQVIDEFKRNREGKIADALRILDDQKIPDRFPQIVKEYPEYKELIKSRESFNLNKTSLLSKLKEDIKNKSLGADSIINDLFSVADIVKTTSTILEVAKNRFDVGKPPGKNSSYGDAINWECLLTYVPAGENLHIICRDNDYISPTDNTSISTYLKDEWNEKKQSQVTLYASLSEFFRHHFPEIKLASEMEKEIAIARLINSGTFESTHKAINKLSKYTDFTLSQVSDIFDAGVKNNQISAIGSDDDVSAFYLQLISEYGDNFTEENISILESMFQSSEITDEDLPF